MLQTITDFFDQRLSPGSATTDEDSGQALRLATNALLLEMIHRMVNFGQNSVKRERNLGRER
jgi:hypothetical protein